MNLNFSYGMLVFYFIHLFATSSSLLTEFDLTTNNTCLDGLVSAGKIDGSVGEVSNQKCGTENSCYSGCCSIWGYCGTSPLHCAIPYCVAGDCKQESTANLYPTLFSGSSCGIQLNGKMCAAESCCSIEGFCGTGQLFCGLGNCQSGLCLETKPLSNSTSMIDISPSSTLYLRPSSTNSSVLSTIEKSHPNAAESLEIGLIGGFTMLVTILRNLL